MTPLCPFCRREMTLGNDNQAYRTWICEGEECKSLGTMFYRGKPRPPKSAPMTQVGEIKPPEVKTA